MFVAGVSGEMTRSKDKKRGLRAALYLPSVSILTDWIGQLCQGLELYIVTGMMRLDEKQLFRGLDKVFHRSPSKRLFSVIPTTWLRTGYSLSFRPEQDDSRARIVLRSGGTLSFRRVHSTPAGFEIVTKKSAIPPLKGERNWSRTEPGPDWAFRNLDKISCGRVDPDWLAVKQCPY